MWTVGYACCAIGGGLLALLLYLAAGARFFVGVRYEADDSGGD